MSSLDTRQFDRRLPALLAAVGLLLSVALEVVHFRAHTDPAATSFCTAGEKLDCSVVALSPWSVQLGIPLPVWGVAAFLAMGLLAWWRSRWLLPLAVASALGSVGLLALSIFAVHNLCLLCEGVHLTSFALLAVTWRDRKALEDTEGMLLVHLLTVPVGLLVSVHIVLTPYWALFSWKGGVHLPHGVDEKGDPWIGAENPKVVLDEYTDYTCPHCAVATSSVRQLLAAHPSELRVIHHNYPRMGCPRLSPIVCLYARAVNCAGDQGKLWEMDSWLFANVPGRLPTDFADAAKELGLDSGKLSACIESDEAFVRADAQSLAASRAHIVDTPSYLLDGKRYVGGTVFPELRRRL